MDILETVNLDRVIFEDLIQGSEEWHSLKLGRISSTSVAGLFVNGKDEYKLGAGLLTECDRVIAEIRTGKNQGGDFSNANMENGIDLEDEAIEQYELENFCLVNSIGFVAMGDYFGDSPDRWVDNDGCLEVKCPTAKVHQSYLRENKVPSKYVNQMYWHMFVGEKKWCDFVSYNPEFPSEYKLFTVRLEMTEEIKSKIETKIDLINSHICSIINLRSV